MKTAKFAAVTTAMLFVVGCGGIDVGGIPVDVGGLNFNGDLNIGDLNFGGGVDNELLDAIADELNEQDEAEEADEVEVGDEAEEEDEAEEVDDEIEAYIAKPHPADANADFLLTIEEILAYSLSFQNDELDEGQDESWLDVAVSIWQARDDGAYFDDMESDEPLNWRSVESGESADDDDEADIAKPHPADENADFLLTSEEILAYASSFQNDELDEGQDESWLDVAVSIWQARADGAYFDDMESDEPLNWRSVESGESTDDEVAEVTDDEADEAVADAAGEGYDILFKVTPLSPVSFDLTVIDPTEKYNSTRTPPAEIGWTEGAAWDGFYRVQIYAGNNYNGVNEQVRFSISVYKDGNLILEEEHALAESSLWDDLSVAYP